MADVQVRAATADDADGVARVHVDSWRETYAAVLPDAFFDEDAYQARRRMWSEYLALDEPYGTLAVADRAGEVVGFAFSAPSWHPDARKGHEPVRDLHLYSVYVMASEHGSGIGRALLHAVLGDGPAQVWVSDSNEKAIGFYERHGFRSDGVEVRDPDLDGITEIRMVR